ncbi:MAG: hypothetical protein WCP62_15675, partial [Planctomycetota bacterium]
CQSEEISQSKSRAEHYWLPACHCLHDFGPDMLMVTVLFLLKPDRLEAYPTCLRPVDHTQTGRAHREGRIDDCRVMIVDF